MIVRHFQVNLDEDPPTVSSVESEEGAPAVDFPYRVSDTELEVFHIVAYTSGCDCSWRANLQWSYRGKSGITVIDDDGEPFRTVGSSKSVLYYPEFDRG